MVNKLVRGVFWAAVGLMFFWSAISSLDPDFGWHLRVGQMMLTGGIPSTDPFSYTMPTFPWVDHGRMSDVAIGWLYPRIGMEGLAALLTLITVGGLVISIPNKFRNMALVPLLMGTGVFVTRFGVRPQVEDWFFIALLLRISSDDELWLRWKWLIPAGFVIWANFHGGFVIGLIIVGFRVLGKWLEAKKLNLKDTAVAAMALAATLVNPYGWKLWEEIWLTVSDTNLRIGIAEWQPFYMKIELGYWLLTALFFALYKIYGKGMAKWRIAVLILLLLGSLSSLRNVPLYVLALIPLTSELMNQAYETVKKNREMYSRAKKFYSILLAIAVILFAVDAGVPTWRAIKGGGIKYPAGAVEYLLKNPVKGRLFSDYGWGGYLIWKLPDTKEFIDGRMPSWRRTAPAGESNWAFKDYETIVNDGNYAKLFDRYGVETVLWPKDDILGSKQSPMPDLSKTWWWKWLVNKTGNKPQKNFIEKMTEKGWIKVYEDKVAVIYTSP